MLPKPIPDKMTQHIDELESFMRARFSRFERKRPIDTLQDAHDVISTMEKMRLFIVYRESEWARKERETAKRTFEELSIWYHAEK